MNPVKRVGYCLFLNEETRALWGLTGRSGDLNPDPFHPRVFSLPQCCLLSISWGLRWDLARLCHSAGIKHYEVDVRENPWISFMCLKKDYLEKNPVVWHGASYPSLPFKLQFLCEPRGFGDPSPHILSLLYSWAHLNKQANGKWVVVVVLGFCFSRDSRWAWETYGHSCNAE